MNITVYMASGDGNYPSFREKARELGTWIGSRGHRLIYGGSDCGIMGEIARSVLAAGGEVIGVEPKYFIDMGYAFNEVTEVLETETMAERRAKLIELGDAFIAFPGGTGTLEEISEVISHVTLNDTPEYISGPCIIYNIEGYWDGLRLLLESMDKAGFSSKERRKQVCFAASLEEVAELLKREG